MHKEKLSEAEELWIKSGIIYGSSQRGLTKGDLFFSLSNAPRSVRQINEPRRQIPKTLAQENPKEHTEKKVSSGQEGLLRPHFLQNGNEEPIQQIRKNPIVKCAKTLLLLVVVFLR
jgi:hypothetical protein